MTEPKNNGASISVSRRELDQRMDAHQREHTEHARAHEREHEQTQLALDKASDSVARQLGKMDERTERLASSVLQRLDVVAFDQFKRDLEERTILAARELDTRITNLNVGGSESLRMEEAERRGRESVIKEVKDGADSSQNELRTNRRWLIGLIVAVALSLLGTLAAITMTLMRAH